MESLINFVCDYWFLLVIVAVFVLFFFMPEPEDNPFTLDPTSSDEERRLFKQRGELIA